MFVLDSQRRSALSFHRQNSALSSIFLENYLEKGGMAGVKIYTLAWPGHCRVKGGLYGKIAMYYIVLQSDLFIRGKELLSFACRHIKK